MHKKWYFLWLCLFPFGVFAQQSHQFYSDISQAWEAGNARSISLLLDDQVAYTQNGQERSYSRKQLESQLQQFFTTYQPTAFTLKHKGSSQDGQIYVIGELDTHSGSRYRIVFRARTDRAGYRIFKLDVVGS